MKDDADAKRVNIVAALGALRVRHRAGDSQELVVWVIPDQLAVVPRPLRYHPQYGASGLTIPASARSLIDDWVLQMQIEGITSIISFMHERDLSCYAELDLDSRDLPGYLELHGFSVCRLPWEDPHHSKAATEEKRTKREEMVKAALAAFDTLQKPVALMCSAGVDRSAPAAACIWKNRSRQGCTAIRGNQPL